MFTFHLKPTVANLKHRPHNEVTLINTDLVSDICREIPIRRKLALNKWENLPEPCVVDNIKTTMPAKKKKKKGGAAKGKKAAKAAAEKEEIVRTCRNFLRVYQQRCVATNSTAAPRICRDCRDCLENEKPLAKVNRCHGISRVGNVISGCKQGVT